MKLCALEVLSLISKELGLQQQMIRIFRPPTHARKRGWLPTHSVELWIATDGARLPDSGNIAQWLDPPTGYRQALGGHTGWVEPRRLPGTSATT